MEINGHVCKEYCIAQVLEIVSSQNAGKFDTLKYNQQQEQNNEKIQNAFADLSQRVYQLRLYSQNQATTQYLNLDSLRKVCFIFISNYFEFITKNESDLSMIKVYMYL